jgi:hypothetical protein
MESSVTKKTALIFSLMMEKNIFQRYLIVSNDATVCSAVLEIPHHPERAKNLLENALKVVCMFMFDYDYDYL